MPIIDDINQAFRDFTAWNVQNPLPVGDPRSGVHNPSKADIRSILLAVLQATGNPNALNSLLSQINSKADSLNSGKVFQSRAAAVAAGQANLPALIHRIITEEENFLVLRGPFVQGTDPLFTTSPYWGEVTRFPNVLLLNGKADAASATPSYTSRAAAVAAAADLPTSVVQILVREGTALVIRSRTAFADDPLFNTGARWGVTLRVPDVSALDNLRNAMTAENAAALRNAGIFSLQSIGGTPGVVTASLHSAATAIGIGIGDDAIVELVPVANNPAGGTTLNVAGDQARSILTEEGAPLPANTLRRGVSAWMRRRGANWQLMPSVTTDLLNREISRLHSSIAGWRDALSRLDSRADDHKAALRDLSGNLLFPSMRPGDAPWLFTDGVAISDASEARSWAQTARTQAGRVARISGAGTIVPKSIFSLEDGRTYGVRVALSRHLDSADPAGDGVSIGFAWYDRDCRMIEAVPVLDLTDLEASGGRQERTITASRAPGSDALAPSLARYARPYVRAFGAGGQVDVEVIEWLDLTAAFEWSPDVSVFDARLGALESADAGRRLNQVEQELAMPSMLWFRSIEEAEARVIPGGVSQIAILLKHGFGFYRRDPVGDTVVSADGSGWTPVGLSTPEHFKAIGDGFADDTVPIVKWMEHGGDMTANGRYRIAAAGLDAGGSYARLLNDVNFQAGPNCEFVAGLFLDNDVMRYSVVPELVLSGRLFRVTWRGGRTDQSLQCNSTIIPNATQFRPFRPGASTTCDGLYFLGWAGSLAEGFLPGISSIEVSNAEFYAGRHWQIAGGDSGLFISGAKKFSVHDCTFIGNRDAGYYGSGLPGGRMADVSGSVKDNTCINCWYGVTCKRMTDRVVYEGNKGINTPCLIMHTGVTDTGIGTVIVNNIGSNAWQLVRIDNGVGAEVAGNQSFNHGSLLEDGSQATEVLNAHNCVVRIQGHSLGRFHDNHLVSIDPRVNYPFIRTIQLNASPVIEGQPSARPATRNHVFDNRASEGADVVAEIAGEADENLFWGNLGDMTTPVVVNGPKSHNRDAITLWSPAATEITGTTVTADLRRTTVRGARLSGSGSALRFEAHGSILGNNGGKRLTVVVNAANIVMPLLVGEGEWVLWGEISSTGSSLRCSVKLATSTGQSFGRAAVAGIVAGEAFPLALLGGLTDPADTLRCTMMRVD